MSALRMCTIGAAERGLASRGWWGASHKRRRRASSLGPLTGCLPQFQHIYNVITLWIWLPSMEMKIPGIRAMLVVTTGMHGRAASCRRSQARKSLGNHTHPPHHHRLS